MNIVHFLAIYPNFTNEYTADLNSYTNSKHTLIIIINNPNSKFNLQNALSEELQNISRTE